MKIKKLVGLGALTLLAAGVFCLQAVFAAETVIYDEAFDNVYKNSRLNVNWWGQQGTSNEAYMKGEQWSSSWGSEGWYSDAEDGSLAVHAAVGASGENGIGKLIIADQFPQNTTVEYSLDFRTPEHGGEKSMTEVWFSMNGLNLFMFKNTSDKPEFGFASTTSWPFTAKSFDRNPNNMTMEYGRDYTVKITLKPVEGRPLKVVVDLYSDGKKLATGIVEEWSNNSATAESIRRITRVGMNTTMRSKASETEPAIYVKRIAVKGIYEEQKPEAELYPADGSTGNSLDTDCYMQFKRSVKDVLPEDVTVTPEAQIGGVTMADGGKRAVIALSGLKAYTKYTINVKNVSETESESSFDYSWSFTTGSSAELGKPYFGLENKLFSQTMKSFSIDEVVPKSDESFENGTAWATSKPDAKDTLYECADGYLWSTGVNSNSLMKRFAPLEDGKTLRVKATVQLSETRDATGIALKLGSSANLANNYTVMRYGIIWSGAVLDALSKNQFVNPWVDENGTGVVIKNREYWHLKHDVEDQDAGLDGDVKITFILKPSADNPDMYDAYVTIKGRKEYTAAAQIAKSDVLELDTFYIETNTTDTSSAAQRFFGISDVGVSELEGDDAMQPGANIAYIDYVNIDESEVFDTDILIVEHKETTDGGYGEILGVTVIPKRELSGANGKIECPFELIDSESTVDFYVLDSINNGVMLSDGTSMKIGQ